MLNAKASPAEQAWLLRQGELKYGVFTGAPIVQVPPEQWGLDPGAVRQGAAARRYRETAPDRAGHLRFEFAPGSFPAHFDPGPGAARRRLTKLLAGQEQFWVSLRRLRLSRADVAEVAAAAGMAVVTEAADPTDRLLLLRRTGLPAEELRPRTGRRITRGHVWAALFAGAALLMITGAVVLRVVAARTGRLPWLDARFDGRPRVAVPQPASLSTELLAEVASRYGYFDGGPVTTGRNETSHLFVKCRAGLVAGKTG